MGGRQSIRKVDASAMECTTRQGGLKNASSTKRLVLGLKKLRGNAAGPRTACLSCTRFRRHRVRCFMEQEVCHGETAVYARVQARGCPADQAARRVVCAGVKR